MFSPLDTDMYEYFVEKAKRIQPGMMGEADFDLLSSDVASLNRTGLHHLLITALQEVAKSRTLEDTQSGDKDTKTGYLQTDTQNNPDNGGQ